MLHSKIREEETVATGKPGSRGRQARVNILAIDVGGSATGSTR